MQQLGIWFIIVIVKQVVTRSLNKICKISETRYSIIETESDMSVLTSLRNLRKPTKTYRNLESFTLLERGWVVRWISLNYKQRQTNVVAGLRSCVHTVIRVLLTSNATRIQATVTKIGKLSVYLHVSEGSEPSFIQDKKKTEIYNSESGTEPI